ncbi:MAG: hypothetical protein U0736_00610 [Gemmataceae bacterium]
MRCRTRVCRAAARTRATWRRSPGLDPPPPERAGTELAAAGGNLLPLAADFPDGTFVGVDSFGPADRRR